jgi:hypothetical protein
MLRASCGVIVVGAVLAALAGVPGVAQEQPQPAGEGWGRLHGRVIYDGQPPQLPDLRPRIMNHPDKDYLLKGDTRDRTWLVDPKTHGLANVVVWLEPPAGQQFPLPPRKTWLDVVTLDTRHGHYEPRITVLYPAYLNPRTRQWQSTGQVFQVTNTSPHTNNVRFSSIGGENADFNVILPAPKDKPVTKQFPIKPVPGKPQVLQSNLYSWAIAYLFAFDHPYVAVTRPDGTFDMPQVPADLACRVRAWHEAVGYLPELKNFNVSVKRGSSLEFNVNTRAR